MTVEQTIKQKLQLELSPDELLLENVSHLHAGHAGDNKSGQSHFNLFIVSKIFEDMNRVERQRAIYALLDEEFASDLHALSIKALAPSEV
jgi:stress-induced morphogen